MAKGLDHGGEGIPEGELPEFYRAAAEELRRQADGAATVEQRIAILEAAERFERLMRGD